MTSVLLRRALAKKHVSQVPAAVHAFDFNPVTVRIRQTIHSSLYLLVERGPGKVGIERVIGSTELRVALHGRVDAPFIKVVLLSREAPSGAPVLDNVALLRGMRLVVRHSHLDPSFRQHTLIHNFGRANEVIEKEIGSNNRVVAEKMLREQGPNGRAQNCGG